MPLSGLSDFLIFFQFWTVAILKGHLLICEIGVYISSINPSYDVISLSTVLFRVTVNCHSKILFRVTENSNSKILFRVTENSHNKILFRVIENSTQQNIISRDRKQHTAKYYSAWLKTDKCWINQSYVSSQISGL